MLMWMLCFPCSTCANWGSTQLAIWAVNGRRNSERWASDHGVELRCKESLQVHGSRDALQNFDLLSILLLVPKHSRVVKAPDARCRCGTHPLRLSASGLCRHAIEAMTSWLRNVQRPARVGLHSSGDWLT